MEASNVEIIIKHRLLSPESHGLQIDMAIQNTANVFINWVKHINRVMYGIIMVTTIMHFNWAKHINRVMYSVW